MHHYKALLHETLRQGWFMSYSDQGPLAARALWDMWRSKNVCGCSSDEAGHCCAAVVPAMICNDCCEEHSVCWCIATPESIPLKLFPTQINLNIRSQ